MSAINYNFEIEKGSDFEISFVYNDSNGDPINLSDACVIFTLIPDDLTLSEIKKYQSFYPPSFSLNADEKSLTSNSDGFITLKLSASETNSFNFDSALYDLDIRGNNDYSNTRIAAGTITILQRNSVLPSGQISNCTSPPPPPPTGPPDPNNPTLPQPTPTIITDFSDFCLPQDCIVPDIFSVSYASSGFILPDLSTVSDQVNINNTGIISNIELTVSGLKHSSPSDLIFLLSPPSGDKILLSANSKITKYNNNFSFTFSNKAPSGKYLNNIDNGNFCNINNEYNKISIINYNNENLLNSFDHLIGTPASGLWNFIVKDTDPLGSGSLDSWKIIITYDV